MTVIGASTATLLPGEEASPSRPVVLRVEGLTKHYAVTKGVVFRKQVGAVHAVDGVSFVLHQGQTLGLVGESGCGKSTVARSILRLVEPSAGRVEFLGQDVLAADPRRLRSMRRDMQIVFQDPHASLNPRLRVLDIIAEPLRAHGHGHPRARVMELLPQVGLAPEHALRYPHEFSGGQCQRIAIARALATQPKLVFCDEPVSALDVSIRGQILNLLADLQASLELTYVLVSHDLSVVRDVADKVAVMYLGQVVEFAETDELYERSLHPYTVALMSAVPIPEPRRHRSRSRIILRGELPSPTEPPPACRFHTRCWKAQDVCRSVAPPLVARAPGHLAACHFPEEVGAAPVEIRPNSPARAGRHGDS